MGARRTFSRSESVSTKRQASWPQLAMQQRIRAASVWMKISEYSCNTLPSLGMQNLQHAHEPANRRGRDVLFFGGHWLRFGMQRSAQGKAQRGPFRVDHHEGVCAS